MKYELSLSFIDIFHLKVRNEGRCLVIREKVWDYMSYKLKIIKVSKVTADPARSTEDCFWKSAGQFYLFSISRILGSRSSDTSMAVCNEQINKEGQQHELTFASEYRKMLLDTYRPKQSSVYMEI